MSYIDIIKELDYHDIDSLKLPYSAEIINNRFDPEMRTIDELLESIITYSYLNLDSKKVIDSLIWKLGGDEGWFNKFFMKDNDKYILRKDIDKVHYNELSRYFNKRHYPEELNIRFTLINHYRVSYFGNHRLLQWMKDNKTKFDSMDMAMSILGNHETDTYKLLYSWGCLWDSASTTIAVIKGLLDVFIWLRNNGCPLNENILEIACKYGRLDMVKYLSKDHELNLWMPSYATANGAFGNNYHERIIDEIYGIFFDDTYNLDTQTTQHFEVLKWLKSIDCPWNEYTTHNAAKYGDLGMLKWLKDNECPFGKTIVTSAVEGDNFEMLKWLVESENYAFDHWSSAEAVKNNNFDILKWLVDKGCPMNTYASVYAARNGNFEILKWVVSNGSEMSEETMACATGGGHFDIVKWLKSEGCPYDDLAFEYAKRHNEIYVWLMGEIK